MKEITTPRGVATMYIAVTHTRFSFFSFVLDVMDPTLHSAMPIHVPCTGNIRGDHGIIKQIGGGKMGGEWGENMYWR